MHSKPTGWRLLHNIRRSKHCFRCVFFLECVATLLAPGVVVFYQVAVDAQVDHPFTYAHQGRLQRGTRVLVPFGKQQSYGVVLDAVEEQEFTYRVKDIGRVLDLEPYYSPTLLQIAHFVSRYYLCPLGRVLALIAPRHLTTSNDANLDDSNPPRGISAAPTLTAAQQRALRAIQASDSRKPVLLHGVTDSGKTELYLHLIAALLATPQGNPPTQFLVMVPEIALTGQMVRVFTQRFPEQVIVTHSALTVRQRWEAYRILRRGHHAVLIGPRSSIFAPFANLRMIIVDEEHDSSYKQGTHLAYHGRDLAVYRGQLERAQVILGSATPSLESWHNALTKKYQLVELRERIHHQYPQQVRVLKKNPTALQLDLSTVSAGQEVEVLSAITSARIAATINQGRQVIVIINRRGFSHYLLAKETGNVINCVNCSVSLTLHDNFKLLKCHYCDHRMPLAEVLEKHQQENFQVCGYGSERIETVLRQKFPDAKIDRLDSDTTARKERLESVLERFRQREIDILVGTQMLAKGHDFPGVALLVILHADQMLSMPDFRAAERTFQLLVQAMGRAGRSSASSEVLVEVERTQLPVIEAALAQDYHAFVQAELAFRQQFHYPPFTRLACLELNSSNARRLEETAAKISKIFVRSGDLQIRGPSDPPLPKINNRYRKVIYFCARDAQSLHTLLQAWLQKLKPLVPNNIRIKLDVDPQSTL